MPQRIVPFPCLWFDREAEEAARFYTSIFDNSRIIEISHYPEDSPRPAGTGMLVEFELDGEWFTALTGGPEFSFDEAIPQQVMCGRKRRSTTTGSAWPTAARKAVRMGEGPLRAELAGGAGDTAAIFSNADPERAGRAMQAMLAMGKLDLGALRAAAGRSRGPDEGGLSADRAGRDSPPDGAQADAADAFPRGARLHAAERRNGQIPPSKHPSLVAKLGT